jgi:histidinol-phosphate/aromatic aminotransferase/cobyric acid decarboxylase-like protein
LRRRDYLAQVLKSLSLEPQRHGGDKADVCKTLGIDPADFIDLSTGLSPFRPVPRAVLEKALDKLGDYSDPCGRSAARAVAALTGVPEECVSVGNGSTELFYAVVRVLEKRRCADSSEIALGSPTFGEIRLAAEVAGLKPAEVVWGGSDLSFDVPEASRILQRSGFGIFFDPTPVVGLAVPEEMREALVSSGLVVWDEAYYALSTGRWLSRWERQARDGVTIIVSSLTKTLSLPGLRAGFLVASPEIVAAVEEELPAWRLNPMVTDVLEFLRAEARLEEWASRCTELRRTFARILREDLGLEVLPGVAPYLAVRLPETAPDATAVRAAMAVEGVGVRDCSSFGDSWRRYIRIGLPNPLQIDEAVRRLKRGIELAMEYGRHHAMP